MDLIAHCNYILQHENWSSPEGAVFVAMPKSKALPHLKLLMAKMGVFESADWQTVLHSDEMRSLTPDQQFETYFSDLTKGYTTDYAFIARYENENRTIQQLLADDNTEPRVIALVDRYAPSQARWLYLTGGIGQHNQPICAGELMKYSGRPRGFIRQLLNMCGILEIEMYVTEGTPAHRGAIEAGYTFEQDKVSGRLRGTLSMPPGGNDETR
jgi:hypothetical protein